MKIPATTEMYINGPFWVYIVAPGRVIEGLQGKSKIESGHEKCLRASKKVLLVLMGLNWAREERWGYFTSHLFPVPGKTSTSESKGFSLAFSSLATTSSPLCRGLHCILCMPSLRLCWPSEELNFLRGQNDIIMVNCSTICCSRLRLLVSTDTGQFPSLVKWWSRLGWKAGYKCNE